MLLMNSTVGILTCTLLRNKIKNKQEFFILPDKYHHHIYKGAK